jgi:hypothetical protein
MGNSFEREEATDLIVRRRSLRATALYVLIGCLAAMRAYVRINSLLIQTIGSNELRWLPAGDPVLEVQPQEARP